MEKSVIDAKTSELILQHKKQFFRKIKMKNVKEVNHPCDNV